MAERVKIKKPVFGLKETVMLRCFRGGYGLRMLKRYDGRVLKPTNSKINKNGD